MKILSWNCNGKFREKFKFIQATDADIYVIQECENPKVINNIEYSEFCFNGFWTGENATKGLGVFAKGNIEITKNNWEMHCLRDFISCKINGKINLVAVWAKKPYIEEYFIYQYINYSRYDNDTIIIGDFNSNAKWDKKHNARNHSIVVEKMAEKEIVSAYHELSQEKHGEETQSTFYMYRNKEKAYHIDYCFANRSIIKHFQIGDYEKWAEFSDHMPIITEIML